MSNVKIPREGSRAREVYEQILADIKDKKPYTTWGDAKSAYDNHYPEYGAHSRRYSGMEVTRQLRRFTTRIGRGQYAPKPGIFPLPHQGPEPRMPDICAACGETYGSHYGERWPGPSDCPVRGKDGISRSVPPYKSFWTSKLVPANPGSTARAIVEKHQKEWAAAAQPQPKVKPAIPRKCGNPSCPVCERVPVPKPIVLDKFERLQRGDQVKCVEPGRGNGLVLGQIYTVAHPAAEDGPYSLVQLQGRCSDGKDSFPSPSVWRCRLEKIPAAPPAPEPTGFIPVPASVMEYVCRQLEAAAGMLPEIGSGHIATPRMAEDVKGMIIEVLLDLQECE